jgi:hypothetical protein
MAKVFVGQDWAEAHHDVCAEDSEGHRLAKARLPEGVEGSLGSTSWLPPSSRTRARW